MLYPREIEYFVAIVQEGNLSAAADKLCISQPALSKYLSKLELDIGTRLLDRDTKRVILTPAGRIYYKAAEQIMNTLYSVSKKIEDTREKGPRQLVIGATGAKSQHEMSTYIAKLLETYPTLKLKIVEYPRDELIKLIKHREIDVGIFANSNDESELEAEELYKTEVQLAVGNKHPLAATFAADPTQTIDIHSLTEERFILPSRVTMFRKNIDKYLESQGIELNVAIETKSKDTAMTYVENDIGIGFFPKYYYKKAEDITYIDLAVPFYHQVSIFYLKDEYIPEHSREFIRLSKEHYSRPRN